MGTILQDLRFALRVFLKSPGFAAVAILTLALGIGANTAIFSVVDAVLLRPLPFPQSDRLVAVNYFDSSRSVMQGSISYPDFFDWRKQNQVFSHITVFHDTSYTLTGARESAHLSAEVVSSDFLATLGVAPALGRGFVPDDETLGHHVAILSNELWRNSFSADPNIVGRAITLNSQSYTVVGVMPPDFHFPIVTPPIQVWTTLADDSDMLGQRGADFMTAMARLKPGVSVAQAQADMTRITASIAKEYPESDLHFASARVVPELQLLVGDVEPALLVLFGAVGCVLLIACANVANLLLARSMGRQKEIAIRAALGAGRARVARQLLTESILLSIFGGSLGLALAVWGTAGLLRLVPEDVPRMSQIQMSGEVFTFTVLASLVTGILFGLAPAVRGSRTDLVDALKESARGLSAGVRHNHLLGALVVAEMALSLALLMGAGLMIRSFARLENVNPGFNPHNVLTFTFDLPDSKYNTLQQKNFYQQALDRLSAMPGVASAAASLPLPLSGNNLSFSFFVEGHPNTKGNNPVEEFRVISPGYFHVMRIPVIEGREFAPTDLPASQNVAIINQEFARRYFPGEDPIGKRINPGLADSDVKETPMRVVVGVVGDIKTRALSGNSRPEFFLPYQQAMIGDLSVILRAQSNPAGLASAARESIRSMDPNLPVHGIETMDDIVGTSVAQPRFITLLLSIFAGLALALTALGLYGVISYSVAQRTHEIGVRVALGAQTTDVLSLVIRQALVLAALGWAAGTAAAFALTRFLSSQLFGVAATDPLTFFSVSFILAAIALLASYIPARRAMRVDPMVALRYE